MLSKLLLRSALLSAMLNSAAAQGMLTAWFPAYTAGATVNWKLTDVAYYFVEVTDAQGFHLPPDQSVSGVQSFIADAHKFKSQAVLSVGGWTGSQFFSGLVANDTTREKFADQIVEYLKKYKFDGVDLDWEYPVVQGIGNNEINPKDSAHLLKLLQLLRKKLRRLAWISLTASAKGLYNPDGTTTLRDYKPYADVVSVLNVMTYDYTGGWATTTGSNSPFQACQMGGSTFASTAIYTNAGFPASKIMVGIPSYSHAWTLKSSTLKTIKTKASECNPILYESQIYQIPEKALDDQPTYSVLRKNGTIASIDGLKTGHGFTRYWDECTKTPFLFNQDTRTFIVYEDAESAYAKARQAMLQGYKGVAIFSSEGFDNYVYSQINQALSKTLPPNLVTHTRRSFRF